MPVNRWLVGLFALSVIVACTRTTRFDAGEDAAAEQLPEGNLGSQSDEGDPLEQLIDENDADSEIVSELPPSDIPEDPINIQPDEPQDPIDPDELNRIDQDEPIEIGDLCTKGNFTKADIDRWIQAAGVTPGGSTAFIYIPPQLLTEQKRAEANLARIGAIKALFHTSFEPTIAGYEDVSDGHCAVYKVDLAQVWGADWAANWAVVTGTSPVGDTCFDPARQPYRGPQGVEVTDLSRNVISAARLAYNIVYPTNYQRLTKTPEHGRALQGQTLAIGGYANGIPCGPRVLALRQTTLNGHQSLYFFSGDPGSPGEPSRALPASPPRSFGDYPRIRRISGSEGLQQLPNGFVRYFIFRGPGSKCTKALRSAVIDPANPHHGYMLVQGRSCITCHNNGIRGVPVDTPSGTNGWTDHGTWEQYFTGARNKFMVAMRSIVNEVSDGSSAWNEKVIAGRSKEPISFLLELIEPLNFSRSGPYSTCQMTTGDKFRDQVAAIKAAHAAELQDLATGDSGDPGVPTELPTSPTTVASPSPTTPAGSGTQPTTPAGSGTQPTTPAGSGTQPTTPAGSSTQPAPAPDGRTAFLGSCGTSGCHSSPESDGRLKGTGGTVPASMQKYMPSNASSRSAIQQFLRGL